MFTAVRRLAQTGIKYTPVVFAKDLSDKKSEYHFIDFIRFVSIIGIVSIHSTFLPKDVSLNDFLAQVSSPVAYVSFMSVLRFAVISFCLISGYLLAPKINKDNRFTFYVERLKAIARPSIIAILITATVIYAKQKLTGEPETMLSVFNELVFEGVFWFIPMQLLSLFILLFFITAPKQLWVGIALFALLAVVTVQYVYIKQLAHVDPVFSLGFVFYFWLGIMFHKWKVIQKVKKVNLLQLLSVWAVSFALLNFETMLLWKKGYPHLMNNLRISNQIYGVVSFFVLIRISDYFNNFSLLNPRKESFGIYLYHRLVGLTLFFILNKLFNTVNNFDALTSVTFTLAHFIFTYVITTMLVKQLIKWELFFLSNGNQYPKASRIFLSLRNSSNIIL